MRFLSLFTLDYLLDSNLSYVFPGMLLLAGFLLGLGLANLWLRWRLRSLWQNRLRGRLLNIVSTAVNVFSLGGLLWIVLRNQGIRLFNLRLWFFLLSLYLLVSLAYVAYLLLFRFKASRRESERAETKLKFLRMGKRRGKS